MKFTKKQLRRIIQEEIKASVNEAPVVPSGLRLKMNSVIRNLLASTDRSEVNAESLRAALEAAIEENGIV